MQVSNAQKFWAGIVVAALSVATARAIPQDHDHVKDAEGKDAGHATTPGAEKGAAALLGKLGPAFSTKDSDGKTFTHAQLKGKPTVLVFIEKGCPCCKTGRPYIDRLNKEYGDVAHVIGVVYGNVADAAEWKRVSNAKFLVLADYKGKIAKSYAAEAGLSTRFLDPSGKVHLTYPGYSAGMLKKVASEIERFAGIATRNFETYPAPESMTTGCPLEGH